MKKLLSYSIIMMLVVAAITLTSCGQGQQANTPKEVPIKVTYVIECSGDLLNLCDVMVTYKGDDGANIMDTITAAPTDSAGAQTWTKTVGINHIPAVIGFDYTFVQKTDTLVTQDEWASLTAKGSVIAEKIGTREGIAHLSESTINSNTNFFVDDFIMAEDVINTRHNLATLIDVYNDRQAYKRATNNNHTCFLITSGTHGDHLSVKSACWNDEETK